MARPVLYDELMRQLSALVVVRRDLARVLPPDCPSSSAAVLGLLSHHGDMRMSTLTELLAVDISVASRHVSHVADRGWIERSPDPADKRSRTLRLTPAGRAKLAELSQRTTDRFAERLDGWSDDEVRQLIDVLTRLRDSFGDGKPPAGPPRRQRSRQQPAHT